MFGNLTNPNVADSAKINCNTIVSNEIKSPAGSGIGTDKLGLPEDGTDRLRLAILVISAPGHLEQREAIRDIIQSYRNKILSATGIHISKKN